MVWNPRSLPWSQEPITCPRSEPREPSSHSPSLFLSDRFKYYPLTMPESLKWSLFFSFCHNNHVHIFLLTSMPHGSSVWGTLIWSLQYATWFISVRYLDLITLVCPLVHQCKVPWSDHASMPHGPSVWGTLIWSLQYATWSISVR